MNQKGFVTLEIILAATAISILIAAAVPKISQMLGKIALDYEIKRFYSEVRFLQTSTRLTNFNQKNFKNKVYPSNPGITMNIFNQGKKTYYNLSRGKNKIRESHIFFAGISTDKDEALNFKNSGLPSLNGHITFKSSTAGKISFYFDSVGRWRGIWEKH